MNASQCITFQESLCEIAGMTSLDLQDAADELHRRGVRNPSFEQCYDMLSSMRMIYARLFFDELRKMKVEEVA